MSNVLSRKCSCGKGYLGNIIQGRGRCDKHGAYHMNNTKSMCSKCAKELNVCQGCGSPLKEVKGVQST